MKLARLAVMSVLGMVVFASRATAAVSFTSRPYPTSIGGSVGTLSGDFNGDGKPDVVEVHAAHAISYYEGIGDGGLRPPIITDVSAITTDIPALAIAADFNGDGNMDVAVLYEFAAGWGEPSSTITVHVGDGAGHFSAGLALTTGEWPHGLAAGDFNSDGNQDLVVASCNLWFHAGNGDGTFQPSLFTEMTPYCPREIIAGNVNGYGGDDLVMRSGSDIVVWNEAGFEGAAPQVTPNAVGYTYTHLALGDLNGDGNADLVVAGYNVVPLGSFQAAVLTFLGSGNGYFTPRVSIGSLGYGVALADFNTDGNLDIVTGGQNPSVVLLGDGNGGVSAHYEFFPLTQFFVVDDFNLDGRPDLAMGGRYTLLINTSPRGCVDTLALGYSASTLNIGFTIKTAIPVQWSAWIAWQNNFVPLWSVEIPAVPTAISFTVPIPGVPPIGNVAVLTTMSSSAYGLMCGDWKFVDTGGIGPTAQTLSNLARSSLSPGH
jgi:hypothetical protein